MKPIEQAFKAINRADFVPDGMRALADLDEALPIGYGQTISQPTTVKLMLEWLSPQPGDRVLDVGSGSGWSSALLAQMVGPEGTVYAVERLSPLLQLGKRNVAKTSLTNVRFYQSGPTPGLPEQAPYDRILVSAAANDVPESLLDQLKPGGRLVIPVAHDIVVITKTDAHSYDTESHQGFVFVPLL